MPFLNKQGRIAHGVAGSGAYVDNVLIKAGGSGGACWFDDKTVIYQDCSSGPCVLTYFDVIAGTYQTAMDRGANTIFGSGQGQWAAWLATEGVGIFSSVPNYHLPTAGLLGMGRDGTLAYRQTYAGTGMRFRELNGDDYSVTAGPVLTGDVCIAGRRQAIWTENNVIKTLGLPPAVVLPGANYAPKIVGAGGKWWIGYWSASANAVVVHPIGSTEGFRPIEGSGWFDLIDMGADVIRIAWSTVASEVSVNHLDLNVGTGVGTTPTVPLGEGVPIPGVADAPPPDAAGTITLFSTGSFGVAGAAEEMVTLPIEIFPAYPAESGKGRVVHPTLGAFDYETKPDEWVNIDADVIIPPMWSSSKTLTSAANVLWMGNIRDVVVEERWKALGGLAMPITQLRMLIAIWTTPIDPDVGYVHWHPNYITSVSYKVLPVSLSVGGQGIALDDVINYKDEYGDPIGWVTGPVTFTMKLVERI